MGSNRSKDPSLFCQSHLQLFHLLGKGDDGENPRDVHPDGLGQVLIEPDSGSAVEHNVHLVMMVMLMMMVMLVMLVMLVMTLMMMMVTLMMVMMIMTLVLMTIMN